MDTLDDEALLRLRDPKCAGEWKGTTLLGDTSKTYRAPFKVHTAAWNPAIELLALASQKGEVCVRRYFWKKGWKRDLCDVKELRDGPSLDARIDVRLESICWSPQGKVLAVGFHDGTIRLLDYEKGFVRFSLKLKEGVHLMRWQRLSCGEVEVSNEDRVSGAVGETPSGGDAAANGERNLDNDRVRTLKEFAETVVGDSLLGTLLLAVDDANTVHVIAAGVLPLARIEPPAKYFVGCDPFSIQVGDVAMSKDDRLLVVYSNMAPLPNSDSSEDPKYGTVTQVVGFDIDQLGCFKSGTIWKIAYRWVHLFYSIAFISETFKKMTVDWEDHSKGFHGAFASFGAEGAASSGGCSLGEGLVNIILNGQMSAELCNFLRNGLKLMEWKRMSEWVDKEFSALIDTVGRELLSGAELFQHHVKQFVNEFECAVERTKVSRLLPSRVFDVDVYPYGGYAEEREEPELCPYLERMRLCGDCVMFKVTELNAVAIRNRKDLTHFMRWLFQTQPFASKRKLVDAAAKLAKFDLQMVLEYISQTFGCSAVGDENCGKEESPGLVEQMNEIFKPLADPFAMEIEQSAAITSTAQDDAMKSAGGELDPLSTPATDAEPEHEAPKLDYSFDKVQQYFSRFESLKYMVDLRNNGWGAAELATVASAERAAATLAQCIRECFASFDFLAERILHKFSTSVDAKSNAYLECSSSEGFDRFAFFPLDSCQSTGASDEVRRYMSSCFPSESVGLSCIGSGGRRHSIFVASGGLVLQVEYTDSHAEDLTHASTSVSPVAPLSTRSISNQEKDENRAETSAQTAVSQPLKVEVPSDVLSELPLQEALSLPPPTNCRLQQFEWVGGGTYFGVIQVTRNGTECVHLFRSSLADKTIYFHEDVSCVESYSQIYVCDYRTIGMALSGCRTKVKWFEIADGDDHDMGDLSRDEDADVDVVGEDPREFRKSNDLFTAGKTEMEFESIPETPSSPSGARLRRSARKRKPTRD